MKKKVFFIIIFLSQISQAEQFKDFLISCGYGTLIGAGAGVVSVAFERNPSEKAGNVARGASFGLYGGIVYGIYQMYKPEKSQDFFMSIQPYALNTNLQLNYIKRF